MAQQEWATVQVSELVDLDKKHPVIRVAADADLIGFEAAFHLGKSGYELLAKHLFHLRLHAWLGCHLYDQGPTHVELTVREMAQIESSDHGSDLACRVVGGDEFFDIEWLQDLLVAVDRDVAGGRCFVHVLV